MATYTIRSRSARGRILATVKAASRQAAASRYAYRRRYTGARPENDERGLYRLLTVREGHVWLGPIVHVHRPKEGD